MTKVTYVWRNGAVVEKPPKVEQPVFEMLPAYMEEIWRDRLDAMTYAMLYMGVPLPPAEPIYDFIWPGKPTDEFSLRFPLLPFTKPKIDMGGIS